jgi:hypothetical protein
MGLPLGPALIDVLHRNFDATPGGEWMMTCHAVRLLASAPKDRTSSEHADRVPAHRRPSGTPSGTHWSPGWSTSNDHEHGSTGRPTWPEASCWAYSWRWASKGPALITTSRVDR